MRRGPAAPPGQARPVAPASSCLVRCPRLVVTAGGSALAAPAPVTFTPPPGLEHYTGTLDPGGLTAEEYQAVRTFLLRAASLPPGPRSALALQLANPVAGRLRPPPPAGISPELYLSCVAAAYQQRQRRAAGGSGPGGGLWTAAGPPAASRLRSPTGGPGAGGWG